MQMQYKAAVVAAFLASLKSQAFRAKTFPIHGLVPATHIMVSHVQAEGVQKCRPKEPPMATTARLLTQRSCFLNDEFAWCLVSTVHGVLPFFALDMIPSNAELYVTVFVSMHGGPLHAGLGSPLRMLPDGHALSSGNAA